MGEGRAITPAQVRAARALLDWSQTELARHSGVSVAALRNFERGHSKSMISVNRNAIAQALREAGVEFIPDGARRCP